MAPRNATDRITLGTLVRNRRNQLRISMDDVADRARVSRATIHRIEHDSPSRPGANKLAQVLVVLGLTPDDIRPALADDPMLVDDVDHWYDRSAAFVGMQRDQPSHQVAHLVEGPPALVVIKDNKMAEIRGSGANDVKEALKSAGWFVMRPD